METLVTKARKLEQFFFVHGIDFIACTKDADGMTVWVYPRTEETLRIADEYREVLRRRQAQKGA